jgi:quercetin dioxygenase-like cupin family protein
MPFIIMDELDKETVTPKYSSANGEVITGETIEVARLRFRVGTGAVEHSHAQEQVMYILSGRLQVTLGGEVAELGPGMAYHALPNTLHKVKALEDTQVISCKNTIGGVGHKI